MAELKLFYPKGRPLRIWGCLEKAEPTWNALLAGIVFQHPHIASLRRELQRNAELRALCGIEIHLGAVAVPTDDALGRFLKVLLEHQDLLDDLDERHRKLRERAEELSADKAYDSFDNYIVPWDSYDIKPLIDIRALWKEDPGKPRVLFGDRADVFLYDEQGRVFCQCPSERRGEDELRELFFCGFEKDRQALKYRCPAAAYGSHCPGRAECESNANVGPFGRVIRVPLSKDRRIFTPIARQIPKWARGYARRSAAERVNSRIDQGLGFEQHTKLAYTGGIATITVVINVLFIVTWVVVVSYAWYRYCL